MFDFKTDCVFIHAFLGSFLGFLIGLALLVGGIGLPSSPQGIAAGSLLFGVTATLLQAGMFFLFYRQAFWRIVWMVALQAILLAVPVYVLAGVVASPFAEPLLMMVVGLVLGVLLGKALCRLCKWFALKEVRV